MSVRALSLSLALAAPLAPPPATPVRSGADAYHGVKVLDPYDVVRGTRYPAVLLTAGADDPRVDAWRAKKMAAALQAASPSGRPVLLRVSGFGHGMGTPLDERIAELADVNAFLFLQLGVPWP